MQTDEQRSQKKGRHTHRVRKTAIRWEKEEKETHTHTHRERERERERECGGEGPADVS